MGLCHEWGQNGARDGERISAASAAPIGLGRRPPGRTRDMLEGLGVPADLVAPQGPLEELDQVDQEREAWADS